MRRFVVSAAVLVIGLLVWARATSPALSPAHAQGPAGDLAARARATLAQTSGTLQVGGLEQPVNVLRDRWGVAHIYARNQHDLFFAQGFVAAQDRLFQMELWKRAGQGRLAEILGPSAVERDYGARLLRYPHPGEPKPGSPGAPIRGDMQAEFASYAPDAREILRAFTDGINAYIAQRSASGLPVEFQLAGFAPEPWKPEDCLTRMAGYPLTYNAAAELYNAQLVNALGATKAAQLLDLSPPVQLDPVAGVDYGGLTPALPRLFVGSDTRIDFANPAAASRSRSAIN